jgi:hypothetical protein
MIVVSDIGDAWSPNIPPLITLAITIAKSKFISPPRARAIGIIILKVPQLVPVANAIIDDVKNIIIGINLASILPVSR